MQRTRLWNTFLVLIIAGSLASAFGCSEDGEAGAGTLTIRWEYIDPSTSEVMDCLDAASDPQNFFADVVVFSSGNLGNHNETVVWDEAMGCDLSTTFAQVPLGTYDIAVDSDDHYGEIVGYQHDDSSGTTVTIQLTYQPN